MSFKAESGAVLDNWEEMDDTDLNSKLKELKRTTIHSNSSQPHTLPITSGGGGIILQSRPQNGQQQQQPDTTAASTPSATAISSSSNGLSLVGTRLVHNPQATTPSTNPPAQQHTIMQLLQKDDDYGGQNLSVGDRRHIEPVVKILRRPEHERTSPVVSEKPRQPVKTLQQREQEYAEARLRILGAAQSPDEQPQQTTSPSAAATTNAAGANNSNDNGRVANNHRSQPHHQQQTHHHHHHQPNNMSDNACKTGFHSTPPAPSTRRTLLANAPTSLAGGGGAGIVRQPRGPDDVSGGFTFRR